MKKQNNRPLINLINITISSSVSNKTAFNKYIDDKKDSLHVKNNHDPYSFRIQKLALVVFLMLVWLISIVTYHYETGSQLGLTSIVLSYAMFLITSVGIAFLSYVKSLHKQTSPCVDNPIRKVIFELALLIASPTWSLAKLYKDRLKPPNDKVEEIGTEEDKKTLFIALNNRVNLFFSAFIAAIVGFFPLNTWWTGLFMTFAVLRTLSRSFEITLAFGNDALDTNKSSRLSPYQRLILAFTSLIECILNYTVAYYLVGVSVGETICKWQAFLHSFQSAFFYINKLLDNSLSSTTPTALSMLQVTQVITCMTLVFIAFVIYISKATEDKNTTTRRA